MNLDHNQIKNMQARILSRAGSSGDRPTSANRGFSLMSSRCNSADGQPRSRGGECQGFSVYLYCVPAVCRRRLLVI